MPYNQRGPFEQMPIHYMDHGDGGMSVLGIIWVVLLAVLAVAVIVALFRWGFGGGFSRQTTQPAAPEPSATAESPIAILDRRLANGEIEVEDYKQRRAVLTGAAGKPDGT